MRRAKPAAGKGQGPTAPSRAKGATASSHSRVAVTLTVGVLVVVASIVAWWRSRPARPEDSALPTAGLSTQNMVDSLRKHYAAHDWDRALKWAHATNVSQPGTSGLLLNEALAWHNYAQDPAQEWPGRSASRTSLDRIELEKRSFALLDSAMAAATTEAERANIGRWQGTQYEVLGLPLDAIQAYDAALKRSPEFQPARTRLAWLQRVIVNPANPRGVTAKDAAPRP